LASTVGPPKLRNDSRYELVDRLARRFGFTLVNKHVGWPQDASFKAYMSAFAPNYRRIKDRHFVLRSLAASITHIPGDTAEAGVFEGASSFIISANLAASTSDSTRSRVFRSLISVILTPSPSACLETR
jgi:hypothetical protein